MHAQLFLMMAILMSSCSTTSTPAELPRIALTSEGGISGRGVGAISIELGRITASDIRRQCTGKLADAERDAIAKLPVLPAASKESSGGHPDQIRYTLTVGDRTMSWNGEDAPSDASPWVHTLNEIRKRVLSEC